MVTNDETLAETRNETRTAAGTANALVLVEWVIDGLPAVTPLQYDEVVPTQVIVHMVIIIVIATPSILNHRHAQVPVPAVVAVRAVPVPTGQHSIAATHLQIGIGVVGDICPDLLEW